MLQAVEQGFGTESEAASDVLHMIAIVDEQLGKYAEAEPIFLKSLRLKERVKGTNDLSLTNRLNNLANVYKTTGRFAEAEKLHFRALQIKRAHLPRDDVEIGVSLNNLANLYNEQGRLAEAEPLYKQALAIWTRQLGPEHLNVGVLNHNLGALYVAQQKYDQAEPLYQRALAIREKHQGADHPDVGLTLNNLGVLYFLQKKFDDSQALHRKNLAIQQARLGPDHPNVAEAWFNIALGEHGADQFEQAQRDYEEALRIWLAKYGEAHPRVKGTLSNLGALQARQGKWLAAGDWIDRSRHSARQHIASVLPHLSDRQQRDFLEGDRRHLHAALSLALASGGEQKIVNCTAEWLLNSKGIGHAVLAERLLMTRDVGDERLKPVVTRLWEVRRCLVELNLSSAPAGKEQAHQALLHELEQREQELMRQLLDKNSGDRLARWMTLAEMRQAIPDGAVFIDIARFQPFNFAAKREEAYPFGAPRYAAWISPAVGQRETTVVDLGPAEEIESAVAKVRQEIAGAVEANGALPQLGEEEAEKLLNKSLAVVAERIWKPLAPRVQGAKRLIISPDGLLWLLPWGAIPIGDGRRLLEDFIPQFEVNGWDLAAPGNSGTPQKPVIFADPDFNQSPAGTKRAIEAVFRAPISDQSEPTRGFAPSHTLPGVARLPNTAVEAQAVAPSIERLTHLKPDLYLGPYALERALKATTSPSLLLLSTHGFFLPDQEAALAGSLAEVEHGRPTSADGQPVESPLLRCGLLFAGCNGKRPVAGDDGILTGMEIVGIDLRGADLVVLSACETGVGKVRNGEGVVGLRQAFQLAGARSVVATLWQVPDRDSSLIMNDFFANLADGQSKPEALRNAQLKRIAARRERFGAAHPFYWGAWTLTGN
jgi:tetratricopeptide (TPR) repeat protein